MPTASVRSGPWPRVLSWILVAGTILIAWAVLSRLPGAGGRVDELRWQLGSARFYGSAVNDAVRLLWDADQRKPGDAARILSALLIDPDPLVAGRALGLLSSELNRQTAGGAAPDPALRGAFAEWLRRAPLDRKVAHGELTLICSMQLARRQLPPDLGDLPISDADHAWIIAGLLSDSMPARAWAELLVFEHPWKPAGIAERLDAISKRSDPDVAVDPALQTAIARDELSNQLRVPLDTIERLVDSPFQDTRFAAGRILAFAGEERGLSAARDWLASRPPPGAALAMELLRGLFGASGLTEP